MTEKLISIIMPVYNCEKYIGQAIQTVKYQKYKNWELIIVNDGSTDNSIEIIKKETQEIRKKTKIINLQENQGVANARNIALEEANGAYIAYLDADDMWTEEKLNKQLEFMEKNNIGFSYTGYDRIKEEGGFSKTVKVPEKTSYNNLLTNTIILTSTIMINVEQIKKELLKMPDLRTSEDTQTWLNILKSGVIAYGIDEELAQYRKRKKSTSANKIKTTISIWKVYRKYQLFGISKSIYYTFMHSVNAIQKRLVIPKKGKLTINIITTLLYQIISIICGFVIPKLIIQEYGSSINGLVSSILQFLAYIYLVEGGIGAVIRSLLYKPIAKNNKQGVQRILKSAKKIFNQILSAYIIYVVILCVIYPVIVIKNFEIYFTIGLIIAIAISRFSEYFTCMEYDLFLQANQQKYVISILGSIAVILNTILTIVLIKLKCSIIFVKLISAIVFVARGICYKIYVRKKYKIKLNGKEEEYKIEQRRDAFAHQIAYIVHSNIDIVLITCVLGTIEVSVYAVYVLVLKGIKSIVTAIMGGVDALFGNLFAKNEYVTANKKFLLYEVIYFSIITILYNLCLILINPFVQVYTIGITDADYYRPIFAIIITLSEFVWAIRYPFEELINTVGHFRQTKKFAYLEAIINVLLSLILVKKLGIIGVAIGTLVAITVRAVYLIYYFSKKVLKRKLKTDIKFIIIILAQTLIITPIGIKICNNTPILTYLSWIIMAVIFGIIISIIVIVTNLLFNKKIIKENLKERQKI